jgi:5-methylcytosine-specific restriction protein A
LILTSKLSSYTFPFLEVGRGAWKLLCDRLSIFNVKNIVVRVDYLAAGMIPALKNQARFNTTSELMLPGRPVKAVRKGGFVFVPNEIYKRRDLHELLGGQRQGGISTPSGQPFIMLFTGDQGQQCGYQAGWSEDQVYLYTGVGKRGDMSFDRGNAAILEHAANGKDIYLFENEGNGYVRYVGEMICAGFREVRGPDVDGNDRRLIVFELASGSSLNESFERDDEYEKMWRESIGKLRKRATASYISKKSPSERRTLASSRGKAIRVYVLRRADGVCESCGNKSPFKTSSGRPYLEPHHIRRECDGGPDDPFWVIGLCPSCHRRAHHSEDKSEFNQRLERIVERKEKRRAKGQKGKDVRWDGAERRTGADRRSGTDQRAGRDRRERR